MRTAAPGRGAARTAVQSTGLGSPAVSQPGGSMGAAGRVGERIQGC